MAWFAKEAGFKGIFFDIENYNHGKKSIFQHINNEKHNFEETWGAAYERGKQFMQAIAEEYPDITILAAYGSLSVNFVAADSPNPAGVLRSSPYGLSAAFFNGMYSSMPKGVLLVDGYETDGYFSSCKNDLLRMVDNFHRKSSINKGVLDEYRRPKMAYKAIRKNFAGSNNT